MASGDHATPDFVPVGTPVDLDNCAPGSVQPRGVLAVVRESDFEVCQVSVNVDEAVRDEPIDDGILRLAETLGDAADSTATWISTAMASSETDDDVTIVTLRRL
ncbi:bacteriophytochrome (light-regulated signal transduction histidine kinase) (plasmid) [Mycolicibacterium chubuense NBB4]|uniref:Bacteriophytochrome (Light-regulated signal transduction histidine kinase) n=1 Tax=Mycolicibacterium chubuense (strain NBB4) TaxID=710421 RepID=I4BS46_MYCCN|nr:signal transduction histidine kinase [Mycolicibacterium chubuense]AFM20103.1 bacteriophytochrome (light-regulated signal transduction histidine kinase) [Mycolicibacterium chubuense NBB4]